MNTAAAAAETVLTYSAHKQTVRHRRLRLDADSVFTRANAEGTFSLLEYGSIDIDAEAGLVIRVHAGCLWAPHHEEHCSVGVSAGEQFIVKRAGRVTVLADRGTQVELGWPSCERVAGNVH